MPNLYTVELKVCATAYIKASTSGEAMDIARKLYRRSLMTNGADANADVPIHHDDTSAKNLPAVSVSPDMTIHGIWSDIEEKEAAVSLNAILEDEKSEKAA